MKKAGVEWAPLNVPTSRRLQTLAVLSFFLLSSISLWVTFFMLVFPLFWPFILPYLFWIFFIDSHTPSDPVGRYNPRVRDWTIWKHFAHYFPIGLKRTVELDPKGNYLFGYHPHGIIGLGCISNFGTNATGFNEKFPGIELRPMTLKLNFRIPFYRELLLALGFMDVSSSAIKKRLTSGEGQSCLIVIGGASEALLAHRDSFNLVLERRKGFVKMAIQTGASLVPVFAFGENNAYGQVPNPQGSMLFKLQKTIQKYTGFTTPLIKGRGVWQYTFGLLPHRTPIVAVVGAPIAVEKNASPSRAEIDRIHKLYVDSLIALFNENKIEFGESADAQLHVVE